MYEENKFEIKNFLKIQKQCQEAKRYSRLVNINGETGTGKTEALLEFTKNDLELIKYIRLSKTMRVIDLEKKIIQNYSKKSPYIPLKTMKGFLIWFKDFLKKNKKKHLIIFDNASLLSLAQIRVINDLNELTHRQLGIVLSGSNVLFKNLNKWEHIDKRKNVPNFYKNINRIITLRPLTKKEIKYICESYNDIYIMNNIEEFLSLKSIGNLIKSINNYIGKKNKV